MQGDAQALRFIDIGANMTDEMFRGIYNGKQAHPDDLEAVLERAWTGGVEKIVVTCGNLDDIQHASELVKRSDRLYHTVGVHPTRCSEFESNPTEYLEKLIAVTQDESKRDKIVAIGEFGLDYDRVNFCPKETQQKYFELQFELAQKTQLPLFLHMRSACDDFVSIVKRNRQKFTHGVVHSFTGTMEEMKTLVELDLFIGVNGCSLKTEENLKVIKEIPNDKIMIETDAPWCDIRSTHAGSKKGYVKTKFDQKDKKKFEQGKFVKGRNEPASIVQVMEVIAGVKGEPIEALAHQIYTNTARVFFP